MSVRVCDRSLSKVEVVYHATEIREIIHGLCIRTFGVKDYDHLVRSRMSSYEELFNKEINFVKISGRHKMIINKRREKQ